MHFKILACRCDGPLPTTWEPLEIAVPATIYVRIEEMAREAGLAPEVLVSSFLHEWVLSTPRLAKEVAK